MRNATQTIAATDHTCCYHVAAARAVLADRERELLELKGACSSTRCRLHYAHSGPCDPRVAQQQGPTQQQAPACSHGYTVYAGKHPNGKPCDDADV